MSSTYTHIPDLAKEVAIPLNGILSRTLYNDDQIKAVLFGFDAGQELSAHTAPVPALIHILQGEADLRLGEDTIEARAGTWVRMPPQLEHGVLAKTPVIMLLLMLKAAK